MAFVKHPSFVLAGVKLNGKTTNVGGQSNIDCGNLWQKFEKEGLLEKINGRLSNEIYAVYFDYEGGHTGSFSYLIGCKVEEGSKIPEGLTSIVIPEQNYYKILAKGEMPKCVSDAWKEIWETDLERAFAYDFEVYDERSKDWESAEVDIFLSIENK